MFQTLSNKILHIFNKIRGYGRLSESDINKTIKNIRIAFLEADVSLEVINHFIYKFKKRAMGSEVGRSLSPSQTIIKIVKQELVSIMQKKNLDSKINLNTQPPAVIVLAGLQGSGKTTSVIKIAKLYKFFYKKKVLVASIDIYRPAAISQLCILSKDAEVDFFYHHESIKNDPIKIAKSALVYSKKKFFDILIVDTAGRSHININMMKEMILLKKNLNPIEILLTIDCMMGQDAINIAKSFDDYLKITGFFLTKSDSDAKGGSALSIQYITGKPIKFIGTGEKNSDIEKFEPEKIANSILGMNDILKNIKDIEAKFYDSNNIKIKKIENKKKFDLIDFNHQLKMLNKIGNIDTLTKNVSQLRNFSISNKKIIDNNLIKKMQFMIDSMTVKEKKNPNIIKSSRKKRITSGSGTTIQDINKMLKYFIVIKKNLKKYGKKKKNFNFLNN